MTLSVECTDASLPPVCTLTVNHHVVCFLKAGGLLVLPHHEFVCQFNKKRLVGWICSHGMCNFHVLVFCQLLGHCQFQGGPSLEHFRFIVSVVLSSASVVTGSHQTPAFTCSLIETFVLTFSRYYTGSR